MPRAQKDKNIVIIVSLFVFLSAFILISSRTPLPYPVSGGNLEVVGETNTEQSLERPLAIMGSMTIFIDIADSASERRRGLSGRQELSEDRGMLFVFSKPSPAGIWMKDMRFPIDILWLDESGHVIAVREHVSPETYPEVFYPPRKAAYVLEVRAGVTNASGIAVGDEVSLTSLSTER